ncbi:PREDICTED: inducible metalloproteinase inhibitor protein-like [Nicrophorus vespilloides]|uniref:Inducible metalloproteinase inhibitor protein-like n=1 Tax=Nicrophorus vespilloides TaxID=110193 RepID=A0ABM1MH47_NICVS|nr:PREDICTED: inducible metalloproteinase inhibitor protein-like [Nicrophorus vespilloides]
MFLQAFLFFILLTNETFSQPYNTVGGIVKNCPKPNEHYECTSTCESNCSTLGLPCRLRFIRCNDVCYCDEGFSRDSKDNCIPSSQCPNKK